LLFLINSYINEFIILSKVICEISNQTKNYAELAGRTQAVVGDVLMSLVNLGLDFKNLDVSCKQLFVFFKLN
jgi:hypothetical protein